jgi:putative peptidoglycan lipid II flippase
VTELASVTEADSDRLQRDSTRIARGAGVIAGLTIVSRILGFARTLVFSQTVGATCLGTAYVTANQVPSLVYELVLAGALASVMVPVLARSAEQSATDPAAKQQVRQITSALLTWTFILLAPVTVIIIAAAGPIASLLDPNNANASCVHADVVWITASMLRVFAPQAILYGMSVVLFGLLQAHRRFAGYALAPTVYSLVLIASYLAFAPLGKGLPLSRLPFLAEAVLSVGTTLGVAAFVLAGIIPTWRLHLKLRPALRLPPGIARRAGGLALVGVIEVVAADIASVVLIRLANGLGTTGALVIVNYALQVFNTLNAVLVIAVVLSAFPVLSSRDGPVFDGTCAGSTRAVMLVACLGVALIAAVTVPAAHVLAQHNDQVSQLILAFALYAPGLIGVGVIANLSRVMLVLGKLKIAIAALAGAQVLVILAQVVLAELAPAHLVVAALALGNTIGQTVAAIPLVIVTRRMRGKAALQGIGRATMAGIGAAAVGALVGAIVSLALPTSHKLFDIGDGVLATGCAIVAFGIVAFLLDRQDVRAMLERVRQAIKLRRARQAPA